MRQLALGLVVGVGVLLAACEDEPETIGTVPTLDTQEPPGTRQELVDRMVDAVAQTGAVLHLTADLTTAGDDGHELHFASWEGWFDFESLQGRLHYETGPDATTDSAGFEEYWFDGEVRYRQGPDDEVPRRSDEAWRGCLDNQPLIAEVLTCGLASEQADFQLSEPPTVVSGDWHGLAAVGIAYAREQTIVPTDGQSSTPSPTADTGTAGAAGGTVLLRTEYTFFVDSSTYFPLGVRVRGLRDGAEETTYDLAYQTDLVKRADFDEELLDPRAAGYRTDDESELELLDHPEGDGPVYWLGRDFDGGDVVGTLVLDTVEQRYHPQRPSLLTLYYRAADSDGALELELWEAEGWENFEAALQESDNDSGRWPFGEACRDVDAFSAGDFQGSIIAGYNYDRPEIGGVVVTTPGLTPPTATAFPSQPCPERAHDEFMAVIDSRGWIRGDVERFDRDL